MAGIPMLQLALNEKRHPFDRQFPSVALRGVGIALGAGMLAFLVGRLPDAAALPLIFLLAMAAIWLSLRFALPDADRASLGKTGRTLRLWGGGRPGASSQRQGPPRHASPSTLSNARSFGSEEQ